MGGGLSHFAGAGTIKRLVNSAGLPLEVDDDISQDQLKDPGKVRVSDLLPKKRSMISRDTHKVG